MANTIVRVLLPSGLTGLTLKLYPIGDETAANGAGDSLAEVGTTRLYEATVTEALTGVHLATIENATGQRVGGDFTEPLADDEGPYYVGRGASQASVDAVAAKTALIGTAGVTFSAPVDEDAVVTVRRARDYANTDGRALEWTNADGTWPDLTGATFAVLVARPNKATALYAFSGSVVTPTGVNQKVRLELTDAQLGITADDYVYEGKATLASGNVIDLPGVAGPFSVLLGRDEPA